MGELQDMINQADRDGDGEINIDEFYRIMKKKGNFLEDLSSDDDFFWCGCVTDPPSHVWHPHAPPSGWGLMLCFNKLDIVARRHPLSIAKSHAGCGVVLCVMSVNAWAVK